MHIFIFSEPTTQLNDKSLLNSNHSDSRDRGATDLIHL